MQLHTYNYTLRFKHPFAIAAGTRNTTNALFVEVSQDGITGYGEAAFPPYLTENAVVAKVFLSSLPLPEKIVPERINDLLEQLFKQSKDYYGALAALDMALHDWWGKKKQIPTHQLFDTSKNLSPLCTYTIGMSTETEMRDKLSGVKSFRLFKLKLGNNSDKSIVKTFCKIRDEENFFDHHKRVFCIDANRAWTDREFALDMMFWLQEQGCVFAEQPMPVNKLDDMARLHEACPLPLILDESIQTFNDIARVDGACSGINIKLVKCGGLYQANKMIADARKRNMKILIGCMSEGSCGAAGASQLSSQADWVDLDGPLLIANDPFKGVNYSEGKIVLNEISGNGIKKF